MATLPGKMDVAAKRDPITGRRVWQLTAPGVPARHHVHTYYDISPWSPDGRRIVYAANVPGDTGAEIWVMDAGGGNKRRVATHPAFNPHTACSQKWMDDRTVVVPGTRDGQSGMRLIDVDTEAERFAPLPGRIDKLSPDGRFGVVTEPRQEVGIVDMQTQAYTRICTLEQARQMTPYRQLIVGEASHLQNPRWSPDGTHVMIVHRSSGDTYQDPATGARLPRLVELFMYDRRERRCYHLARINHHPGWHPNGRDVFFVGRNHETGLQDLRLVARDGGEERVIFDGEHLPAGHPSFHPLHHHLLVTDCYGGTYGYGIVLINLRTQRLTHLASQPFGEDPATAPEAHAYDPPNWGSWSYTRSRVNAHPRWKRDGSVVLYNDLSAGTSQLYQVDTADIGADT